MTNVEKILGKYKVERQKDNKFIATHNEARYIIEIIKKSAQSGMYSNTARSLSAVNHTNISNLAVEEDDENFYFIGKLFGEYGYSKLEIKDFKSERDLNYQRLINCYLQIISAIRHIHLQGFYHGNIKPENILIDRADRVYLLDFGRSYLYSMLKNEPDKTFCAPEQIKENEICQESDVYSFGLCMLKLIVDNFEDFDFFTLYKDYRNLESLFAYITDEYELESIESELFLLARQMLAEDPKDRIDLISVQKKLKDLLLKNQETFKFAMKLHDSAFNRYRENNDIDQYKVIESLEDKLKGYESFWEFGKDRDNREEIRIAIGDLIFLCSVKENQPFLFCFSILENRNEKTEYLSKNGIKKNAHFELFKENRCPSSDDYNDASYVIEELREQYKEKQLQDKRLEIDKKFVKTEEELLQAEKKTIEEKKNTKFARIKSVDRGRDEIIFEFIKNDDKVSEDVKNNVENASSEESGDFGLNLQESRKQKWDKDFKPKQKVIIEIDQDRNFSLSAEVESVNHIKNTIILKFKQYETNEKLNQNLTYKISYDYQVEEIIWNKQNRALEDLKKANATIPNFLRKLGDPKEFIKNDLVDIKSFFNQDLDENQQEAVRKSLSLGENCEVLLIQGPPGTGKTTTITEIVQQILSTKKHEKILVASQSNQAVDNVLEKVCESEGKILRIGSDPKKMSEKAQKYRAEEVINKIINKNLEQIKANPISHENEEIRAELKSLQDDFAKRLQSITSKTAEKKDSKESEIGKLFTKHIRLIFGTLIGISSWKDFREIAFDTVIVDEAGRATLSELLVPCIKGRKIIFVGDHKQLAPVIDDDVLEKVDDKDETKISFFQRFFERIEKVDRENLKHTLMYNYRSEQRICELYSNAFYDGQLKVKDEINSQRQHDLRPFKTSVVWFDTGDFDQREDEQRGTGKINKYNAKIVKTVLKNLYGLIKEENLDYDLGIITPYKDQVNLLKETIKSKDFEGLDFLIGTVDSFQGSDRDVVIYDCVRSSKNKQQAKIDFIADEKRLNVSLSRAKRLLVIVGDMDFLYNARTGNRGNPKDNPFVGIIEYINKHKEYYHKRGTNGKEKS